MSELDFDGLEEKLDEERSTDYEPRDPVPWIRVTPTTVLGFDDVVDTRWTGTITDNEGNSLGPDDQGGSWIIRVEDPRVLKGDVYENKYTGETYEDDGESFVADHARDIPKEQTDSNPKTTDYLVADPDGDVNFEKSYDREGEIKGVTAGYADELPVVETEEIGVDEAEIYVNGTAGQFLVRALDQSGAQSAYVDENGENTKGIMEFPPDDVDVDKPRVARYPEFDTTGRLQFEDNGGFIYFSYRDPSSPNTNRGYDARVFYDDFADDPSEATVVEPVVNRTDDLYGSNLKWHDDPIESDAESDESGAQTDASDDDTEEMSFGVEDDSDASGPSLSDAEQTFVEQFHEQVGIESGEAVVGDLYDDERAFAAVVEENLGDDADPEKLATAIEAEA